MYFLNKYILYLIVSCLPAITLQNFEIVNQDQQLANKDSVSENALLNKPSEDKLKNQTAGQIEQSFSDSTIVGNIEWKFRKQIILGN